MLSLLREALCVCLVNRVIHDAFRALPPDVDVVQFYVLRPALRHSEAMSVPDAPTSLPCPGTSPVSFGPSTASPARPPVPPIPPDVERDDLSQHRNSRPSHHAVATAVVRLGPHEGRYTVIGTFEGAINRNRQPQWDAARCRDDAVATAPRRGHLLSGRVLEFPLPALFLPQVLPSRAPAHQGWTTIALDLRPLHLGVKAIEVRVGTTISQIFTHGSPLYDELREMGRMCTQLQFRINSRPVPYQAVMTLQAETLTLEPSPECGADPEDSLLAEALPPAEEPHWSTAAQSPRTHRSSPDTSPDSDSVSSASAC